jgi:hypothetical protein
MPRASPGVLQSLVENADTRIISAIAMSCLLTMAQIFTYITHFVSESYTRCCHSSRSLTPALTMRTAASIHSKLVSDHVLAA